MKNTNLTTRQKSIEARWGRGRQLRQAWWDHGAASKMGSWEATTASLMGSWRRCAWMPTFLYFARDGHGPAHRPVFLDPRDLAPHLVCRIHPVHSAHLWSPRCPNNASVGRQPAQASLIRSIVSALGWHCPLSPCPWWPCWARSSASTWRVDHRPKGCRRARVRPWELEMGM